jgi:hypothetical protein
LGILALQMNFIGRDALIAAMNAWVLDKSKSLGDILVLQQALAAKRLALLESLVEEHLNQHGRDPEKSLAGVGPVDIAREKLNKIADADVKASLSRIISMTAGRCKEVERAALAPDRFTSASSPARDVVDGPGSGRAAARQSNKNVGGSQRLTVQATYENGVLKPHQPLPEHAMVQVTVMTAVSRVRQTAGLIDWTGSQKDADFVALSPDLDPQERA